MDPPSGNPDEGAVLAPSAIAQIEALLKEKEARTPAQRKISSALLYAQSGRFAQVTAEQLDPAKRIVSLQKTDASGRVLVDIRAGMDQIAGKIEALGGKVVSAGADHARAWMPLGQLEPLAVEPAVRAIRPALTAATARIDQPGIDPRFNSTYEDRVAIVQAAVEAWNSSPHDATPNAASQGSRVSQGDKAHATDRARRFYGVDGTGIKIGVLSDSDDFKEQSIATGDLPADTVTLPGQSGRPGAGEGTAMMQIVHDLAPGAQLFFATAFTSPESFADNIRALRQAGCDIIIDDIIYFFESPFQDDIIAQAVDDVTKDGAMYFSSAGNEGNFSDGTSGTWEGDFRAQGTLATLPSGYTVHSFGNGVISNRIEASGGPLLLHWSDPGTLALPASSNDYDLFVLDDSLRTVQLAATDIQDGDDLPFEFIGFGLPPGLRVVVAAKPGAQTRAIRTEIFRGQYGISTSGASYGHSAVVAAYGVAAVDAAQATGGEFTAGPTTPLELFSGDGPRHVFFDRNNNPINADKPGQTFASGGGSTRAKPDIAAADGVATTLPSGSGLNPFFGTSAAAPHAGAIAALAKAALPGKTTAQIRAALVGGALDIEATGTDRDSGRGIVSAFNTLTRIGARAAVTLEQGAVTVTPLGATRLRPGGSATLSVGINNGGGAAATAVSAVLTSSSPDVLILNGTSSYSDVPSAGAATNNQPFAFFINSSAVCGALLPFTLTVNYTGNGPHPVVFNFSLQTGGPSNTFSHFAYGGAPVLIPLGNPVGVDVPFDVSGFAGAIAKLKFNIDGATCSTAVGATTVGIDHSWAGDLILTLRSPSGRSVIVLSEAGGPFNSGNNFCQTILDDNAPNSIENVTLTQAPFTGTFSPFQPLAGFNGDGANGTWILHAQDLVAADTGSVRAFSIDVAGFSCD
ncbi:MAG TPA: S8 family serine peptidase [Kofleriaceae bacterium]|nr:S8 family serine peptidase [Kofleriaceae bacterium]